MYVERRRETQFGSPMRIGSIAQGWKSSSVEYAESTAKIRRVRIPSVKLMCVTTPEQRIPAGEIANAQ
jgi:hypothetical protein